MQAHEGVGDTMTTTPNRATFAIAGLALALLAGAGWALAADAGVQIDPTANDPSTSQGALAAGTATAAEGCTEQLELWPLPAAAARAMTPEGFEPASGDPAGASALAFFLGFACEATGDEQAPGAALVGGLLVDPPEEAAGGADQHAIVFETWSDNPELRASFEAWSWGTVHEAAVDVEVPAEAAGARSGHLQTSWEGNEIHVVSEVAGPTHSIEDFTMRVFGLGSGGDIATTVDWRFGPGTSQGPGTASFLSLRGALLPPPSEPGMAFHAWGEDYGYSFETVDEGSEDDDEDGDTELPDSWPPLAEATIRPGVPIAGGCTANFVFASPDNATLYLGTASHCVVGDAIGDPIDVAGERDAGRLAYCSWGTMADEQVCPSRTIDAGPVGVYDPRDEASSNDFALVAVTDEHRPQVHPAVVGYGGPAGLAEDVQVGERALVHGNSSLDIGPAWDWRDKEGYVVEREPWTTDVAAVPPAVPGDSGSPVLSADGEVIGHVIGAGSEGVVVTNLAPALAFAEDEAGLEAELVTAEPLVGPTLPALSPDTAGPPPAAHGLVAG